MPSREDSLLLFWLIKQTVRIRLQATSSKYQMIWVLISSDLPGPQILITLIARDNERLMNDRSSFLEEWESIHGYASPTDADKDGPPTTCQGYKIALSTWGLNDRKIKFIKWSNRSWGRFIRPHHRYAGRKWSYYHSRWFILPPLLLLPPDDPFVLVHEWIK